MPVKLNVSLSGRERVAERVGRNVLNVYKFELIIVGSLNR